MNDTTVHGTLEGSIAYTFRVFRISASFELRSIGHSPACTSVSCIILLLLVIYNIEYIIIRFPIIYYSPSSYFFFPPVVVALV